ncbi:MAG: hypothetical protein ACK4UP_03910 [Spirosomataceae bacterium]
MNCLIETHQFLSSWTTNLNISLKEKYNNSWIDKKEVGYFGFIPKESTAIFLGTFPVPEIETNGFFYHSSVNNFWKIIAEISKADLTSIDNKLKWLHSRKIGITDILCKAQRTDEKCISRADKDLNAICFNNIANLLDDYPSIMDIFLTSGGPTSKSLSGKSAGGWLGLHLREATGKSLKKISKEGATLKIQLQPNGREINLHFLITPAPQDNQLGKFLRDNINARNQLDNSNLFPDYTDRKEKYKLIQWAVTLSKIKDAVSQNIVSDLQKINLKQLLMERQQ